jgi:hypothetical protein
MDTNPATILLGRGDRYPQLYGIAAEMLDIFLAHPSGRDVIGRVSCLEHRPTRWIAMSWTGEQFLVGLAAQELRAGAETAKLSVSRSAVAGI